MTNYENVLYAYIVSREKPSSARVRVIFEGSRSQEMLILPDDQGVRWSAKITFRLKEKEKILRDS